MTVPPVHATRLWPNVLLRPKLANRLRVWPRSENCQWRPRSGWDLTRQQNCPSSSTAAARGGNYACSTSGAGSRGWAELGRGGEAVGGDGSPRSISSSRCCAVCCCCSSFLVTVYPIRRFSFFWSSRPPEIIQAFELQKKMMTAAVNFLRCGWSTKTKFITAHNVQ